MRAITHRIAPAEAILLLAVLLWGLNTTSMRYGVTHGFAPLVFIALRWAIAGIGFAAVTSVSGRRPQRSAGGTYSRSSGWVCSG